MHPSLERLIASRKLALVLDLDHTLLNSVLVPDLRMDSNWLRNAMRLLDADVKRAEDANDPLKRSVFHLQHFDLLTKLRPGVRRFLERASRLFEIHINTMGSQAYADQMVELLDPEKRWIHGTVRGLGEMEGGKLWAPAEKTLDGALEHLADACLIFDDTASVWESHRRNLVTCERYLFFPQARRQFGLSGMSLLEIGQDESEDEGMLSTAMKVFESVHSAYFAGGYDKNVKHKVRALKQHASDVRAVQEILCAQRKKVLADVRIVFSRVFPIDADPTTHPLWILAEDFGATCGRTLCDDTTHVVGTASSTDKVKAAKARGNVHAVTPHWLECSMLLWRRANEATFRI
jgi:RNA polymerase II C-terminal domain phosphatase-like 3/4